LRVWCGGRGAMRLTEDDMKSVLITGASSGIGEAVAVECARRGAAVLFLGGRDRARLEGVAARCRELGAAVRTEVVDVTDEAAMRDWIEKSDADTPLDLVFANAGIATGTENEANVRRTFATNVGGVLNCALPAIECFRRHGGGQLVLTASIAGYAPLVGCPAYSGTKACVKAWGLAMRGFLKKENIRVNVVCPGFVRSRLTDVNTCPMPFFMEAPKAARIIVRRVLRDVPLIAFPWPMRLAVWWLSVLPARVTEWITAMLPEKVRKQGVITEGAAK